MHHYFVTLFQLFLIFVLYWEPHKMERVQGFLDTREALTRLPGIRLRARPFMGHV